MARFTRATAAVLFVGCAGDSHTTATAPMIDAAAAPAVVISPNIVAVVTGATQRFTATVLGRTDTVVGWSVQEPSDCGAISASGDYTAPTAPATCHVVATLGADPALVDVATVVTRSLSVGGMPHVSTGKPAFASEGAAALLTDGAYGGASAWRFEPSHCTPSAPCWAAVNVGAIATRLLVDWSYQDGDGARTVSDYELFVSPDSTNGDDGTWTPATDALTHRVATVGANTLVERSHLIELAGYSWVKLAITSSTADAIDELDLWDASSTSEDSFFFHGDGITRRCASLRGAAEQPSFQAQIQAAHPTHYPLEATGGGESSADATGEIGAYISLFRPVKYWFFAMGTNDLCGGASAFAANAQRWIDAVKAADQVPILVHPIWANDSAAYCSENGPALDAAVDQLVSTNGLMPAVPLYEATVGHPEYFDAGSVDPNAAGCAVWNKIFADAVSSFYP